MSFWGETPASVGAYVWVAEWDVRNAGTGVSLHATKVGAIHEAIDGLDPDRVAEASAALDNAGSWQDHEDDPRVCLYVHKEVVNT